MSNPDATEMQAQAAQWFARLQSKDCSDAERMASQRWRAQSPAHEAAFRQAEALWQQCLAIRADPALAEGLRQVEREDRRRARRGRYWPPLLAAAAVLGVLSLLAPRLWQASEPPGVRHQTAVGEQRTVALPDGSIVVLDTSTVLLVRYTDESRRIALETGQASFKVTRDANRPFQVQAAGGSVTAVGTEFLVRVEPAADAAVVTLLEGQVRVEAPPAGSQRHAPATLAAGQQLRYGQAGQWTTSRVDLEAATAWTRGSVHAEDWRLADLLAEMNRYSSIQLRLADPSLSELRVTGVFRTGDPLLLQRVLEHSLPVQAQPGQDDAILLARKPSAQ